MKKMIMGSDATGDAWSLLTVVAGAPDTDSMREQFFYHHSDRPFEVPSEFRFQGNLGFGGKFNVRWDGSTYVDCYPEDETDDRRAIINQVNADLERYGCKATALP